MLFLVNNVLENWLAWKVGGSKNATPIWKALKSIFSFGNCNIFYCWVLILFMVLMQVGVDQNCQFSQSITQIHAGDNEINCKYCHSSARVVSMEFLL
jgi:hypothetical protein